MVTLVFEPSFSRRSLQNEHNLYFRLFSGLRAIFDNRKPGSLSPVDSSTGFFDKDPFQTWLANSNVDAEQKAQVVVQSYYVATGIEVSIPHALALLRSGSVLQF